MKLRWMIPLFWSTVTTVFVLFLFVVIGRFLIFTDLYQVSLSRLLVFINRNIGYPNMYVITAVPVFIVALIYFFTRDKRIRSENYLMKIAENVRRIAAGDFNHKVPVENIGEWGNMAANINRFVDQLNTSIAEERRAEQTKNELITNVSHDLRTPLTSITGYLGLIEQDRYRDEVELRYYVTLAYEESERMNQLIQDLFEYTRLRNNEMKINKEKINLVEMLYQMSEQFRLQLAEAGIELRMSLADPMLAVMADGNKLRRVFENLVTNAIKYGYDGRYLDIIGHKENGIITIDIINYGEPIPQSALPHIFERFYRVEKSRATDTGGSGLGLAIAKQIVELHGGTIAATSTPEHTAFTVRMSEVQGR
ncbi:HAMP domain-containing histidine kinase [Paenibacillus spongiae]|uniref:histidine kinase n=3 Tax=Paenibacillus spongiae TaxID=2909671 RepID=A0ABY5S416_9BACL|nr:HAMP domain-containing sensor histidine kinase [Paenibacillus spongiae]UVI27468.1 HAMP domain-containing histidine kinase [Paenibacillus spongiae]